MYIFLTLFTIANGFINSNSRGNTILYSSAPPMEPPTDSLLVGLGGNEQDIRPLTREQAQLVLEIWTTSPDWETTESKLMTLATEKENSRDIYLGYCPEYRGKHTIRYLFHSRVVFGENPYLSILNGVRCPFDDSDLPSYKFKEKVTEAISILPISFAALMKNPKFSLSWNLEKIENKYKDGFDGDDEGDYI
tara:strand:+ start:487 stop:1062 length:576 start_codon:yes stop_codon:yes gene_type:complete